MNFHRTLSSQYYAHLSIVCKCFFFVFFFFFDAFSYTLVSHSLVSCFFAFSARKNEFYENFKLSLKWNRSDIAKTEILTGEENFEMHQLTNLMEMAISENKPDFIDILLENRVNLYSFLTYKRLYYFYNSIKVSLK